MLADLRCRGNESRLVDCLVHDSDLDRISTFSEGSEVDYGRVDYSLILVTASACDPFRGSYARIACGTDETASMPQVIRALHKESGALHHQTEWIPPNAAPWRPLQNLTLWPCRFRVRIFQIPHSRGLCVSHRSAFNGSRCLQQMEISDWQMARWRETAVRSTDASSSSTVVAGVLYATTPL